MCSKVSKLKNFIREDSTGDSKKRLCRHRIAGLNATDDGRLKLAVSFMHFRASQRRRKRKYVWQLSFYSFFSFLGCRRRRWPLKRLSSSSSSFEGFLFFLFALEASTTDEENKERSFALPSFVRNKVGRSLGFFFRFFPLQATTFYCKRPKTNEKPLRESSSHLWHKDREDRKSVTELFPSSSSFGGICSR